MIKPSLLAVERVQIVALHMERLSERQIAKSSVHRIIEKFKKHENYDNINKLVDSVKLHKAYAIMPSDELLCNLPLVLIVKYVPMC